jgi:hypothetical protein
MVTKFTGTVKTVPAFVDFAESKGKRKPVAGVITPLQQGAFGTISERYPCEQLSEQLLTLN